MLHQRSYTAGICGGSKYSVNHLRNAGALLWYRRCWKPMAEFDLGVGKALLQNAVRLKKTLRRSEHSVSGMLMSDEELEEPARIKALFNELIRQPMKVFSRGCRNVPNEDGVYVIYGLWDRDVRYVGRTIRAAAMPRAPFKRGLRRRLPKHSANYGALAGFRFLVVRDPRQRALLEAYATGVLCPADLATGYKPTWAEIAPAQA